jgi:hypothetical protein
LSDCFLKSATPPVGRGVPAKRSRRAAGHYEVADVRNVPGAALFVTATRPRTPVGKLLREAATSGPS